MKTWLIPFQQQLTTLIVQHRVPHALLFHGMTGSGKQILTHWFVKLLSCTQVVKSVDNENINVPCGHCKSCLLFAQGTYPDHKELLAEKGSIGVDDIRTINSFLEKTAFFGTEGNRNDNFSAKKIVVIAQAEKMTISAANALLKTLEEPSDNSIIILITTELESLLPTVISRCRLFSIRPPVGNALIGTQKELIIDNFVNISQLPELSDNIIKEQYDDFLHSVLHYLHHQQSLDKITAMLVDNTHAGRWYEKIIVTIIRSQHNWQLSQDIWPIKERTWISKIEKGSLWQVYQLILVANKKIALFNQTNKQYVYEKLLINSAAILSVE